MAKPGKAKTRMTDIIEAVARAMCDDFLTRMFGADEDFEWEGKPPDNPAEVLANWREDRWKDNKEHFECAARVATPLITEKVLREMARPSARVLLAACPTLTDGEAVAAAKVWTEMLRAYARERGIDLDGDGNG